MLVSSICQRFQRTKTVARRFQKFNPELALLRSGGRPALPNQVLRQRLDAAEFVPQHFKDPGEMLTSFRKRFLCRAVDRVASAICCKSCFPAELSVIVLLLSRSERSWCRARVTRACSSSRQHPQPLELDPHRVRHRLPGRIVPHDVIRGACGRGLLLPLFTPTTLPPWDRRATPRRGVSGRRVRKRKSLEFLCRARERGGVKSKRFPRPFPQPYGEPFGQPPCVRIDVVSDRSPFGGER